MKKKTLLSLLVATLVIALGSCKSGDATDGKELDLTKVAPPFTVTGYKVKNGRNIRTFTYEVKDNGMYTLTQHDFSAGPNDNFWVETQEPITTEGRWTTRERRVGDDFQKVYVIHVKYPGSENIEDYIPTDFEYLYNTYDAAWDGKKINWETVSNFNTSKGYKIIEVSTPNGRKIIEDIFPEVEYAQPLFAVEGKDFVYNNSYGGYTEGRMSFSKDSVEVYMKKNDGSAETDKYKYELSGEDLIVYMEEETTEYPFTVPAIYKSGKGTLSFSNDYDTERIYFQNMNFFSLADYDESEDYKSPDFLVGKHYLAKNGDTLVFGEKELTITWHENDSDSNEEQSSITLPYRYEDGALTIEGTPNRKVFGIQDANDISARIDETLLGRQIILTAWDKAYKCNDVIFFLEKGETQE